MIFVLILLAMVVPASAQSMLGNPPKVVTYTNKATWEATFANIRQAGVSRALISTDLGQSINPPVAEGFAMFAQKLLDAGFSSDDVRTMAVTNPARLVEE